MDSRNRPVGVILTGDTNADWREYIRSVDASGFWGLGVGDSQSIYPDAYVRLAVAALETRSPRLAVWVTNPLTRHPAVTANAIASIDDLSRGRAILGIGTGDSSVANLGLKSARLDELEDYVRVVDELQTKGESRWRGAVVKMERPARRVPIYVAATGPKALRLAGRIGDGVVVLNGVTPDVVADTVDILKAGAAEAGRDYAAIDKWWITVANLAEDDATALDEIKGSLATFANVAFKSTLGGKRLPPQYVEPMARLREVYDMMKHGAFGPTRHGAAAEELGLLPYFEKRFSISGGPAKFLRMMDEAHAGGAEKLWLTVRGPEKRRFLRIWSEAVAPRLAGA